MFQEVEQLCQERLKEEGKSILNACAVNKNLMPHIYAYICIGISRLIMRCNLILLSNLMHSYGLAYISQISTPTLLLSQTVKKKAKFFKCVDPCIC